MDRLEFALKKEENMKLSLCCIMKNEEKNIEDFVKKHINSFDEILIVDNGSTDSSVNIAEKCGAKVMMSNLPFDLARNVYLDNASSEWIVVLDVDEMMMDKDVQNLKEFLCKVDANTTAVIIPGFQYFGDGKWATWYLPRVMKSNRKVQYESPIHGSISDSVDKQGGVFSYFYAPFHHFDGLVSEERNLDKRIRNTKLLKTKLEVDSKNIKLLNAYASELCVLKNTTKAIEIANYATTLDVNGFKRSFQRYASICYANALYEEAIKSAEKQINMYKVLINQGSSRSVRFKKQIDACNIIIAKSYYKLGDINRAKQILLENISENPELPHNYYNYYLLVPERLDMLAKAKELNPLLNEKMIFVPKIKYSLYENVSSIID